MVVRLNEQTSLNLLHIERVSVTKEQDLFFKLEVHVWESAFFKVMVPKTTAR